MSSWQTETTSLRETLRLGILQRTVRYQEEMGYSKAIDHCILTALKISMFSVAHSAAQHRYSSSLNL